MRLLKDHSEGVYREMAEKALQDFPAVIIGIQGAIIAGLVYLLLI